MCLMKAVPYTSHTYGSSQPNLSTGLRARRGAATKVEGLRENPSHADCSNVHAK